MNRAAFHTTFALACLLAGYGSARAADPASIPAERLPAPSEPAAPTDEAQTLPINLPTALRLANVRALDIAAATERLQVAMSLLRQAEVLWVPTVSFGFDYFRHDGKLQDIVGNVITTSRSAVMAGAGSGLGSSAVISVTDAVFAPLAARQTVRAREAAVQTASNDALLDVTEAYMTVQQARGELAGALEVSRHARDLEARIGKLAEGLVPPVESVRARAELARRQQAELAARQRWRLASADLIRVLNLDPTMQVAPVEPPTLRVAMVDPDAPLADLLLIAQANRPELASQQANIAAAQTLVRQEKYRPLLPSVVLRGASTNPAGTLGVGVFAGGINSNIGNAGGRFDYDLQVLWQLDNLGLGNVARVRQRQAETRLADVEFLRLQTVVNAEVSRALAELRLALQRIDLAEKGLSLAIESLDKNLAGMQQTRRVGATVTLVVRPQEAVAAVQALAQAYLDYYGSIADANRAQFRLYRALGRPAKSLLCQPPSSEPESGTPTFPPRVGAGPTG